MQEGGESLSAFFLPKYVPELGKSVPVECVFQAGNIICHKKYGKGVIEKIEDTVIVI